MSMLYVYTPARNRQPDRITALHSQHYTVNVTQSALHSLIPGCVDACVPYNARAWVWQFAYAYHSDYWKRARMLGSTQAALLQLQTTQESMYVGWQREEYVGNGDQAEC